jgi:hypothetical protein
MRSSRSRNRVRSERTRTRQRWSRRKSRNWRSSSSSSSSSSSNSNNNNNNKILIHLDEFGMPDAMPNFVKETLKRTDITGEKLVTRSEAKYTVKYCRIRIRVCNKYALALRTGNN